MNKNVKIFGAIFVFLIALVLLVGSGNLFSIYPYSFSTIFDKPFVENIGISGNFVPLTGGASSQCGVVAPFTVNGSSLNEFEAGSYGYLGNNGEFVQGFRELRAVERNILNDLNRGGIVTFTWVGNTNVSNSHEVTLDSRVSVYSSSNPSSSLYTLNIGGQTRWNGFLDCSRSMLKFGTGASHVLVFKSDGLYLNGAKTKIIEKVFVAGKERWYFDGKEVTELYVGHSVDFAPNCYPTSCTSGGFSAADTSKLTYVVEGVSVPSPSLPSFDLFVSLKQSFISFLEFLGLSGVAAYFA